MIGFWGYLLCFAACVAAAVLIGRREAMQMSGKLLVVALSLTAVWALSAALAAYAAIDPAETGVLESLRNCGWLVCLFIVPGRFGPVDLRERRGAVALYSVLVLLLVAQAGIDVIGEGGRAAGATPTDRATGLLRLLWALGALLLIQRAYVACGAQARARFAPVAAALAAMWGYDLLIYALVMAARAEPVATLLAGRGWLMAPLAPVVALSLQAREGRPVSPSRKLALHGVWTGVALALALGLLSLFLALRGIASPVIRTGATGLLFLIVVGALLFLPASRLHAALKILVAKHLFRHRYDYREQWMAFADTLGRTPDGEGGIPMRLAKAMATITGSAGAALLMPDEEGVFVPGEAWQWTGAPLAPVRFAPELLARLRTEDAIIDIARARDTRSPDLPPSLVQNEAAWALVPLVHFDELVGVVLLGKPPLMRALDWEDFDMLRTAGRQAASYLAEARGQRQLAEARRFEEFNRRFSFIIHDIKNLVSQIALLARNAERHADNPAFRADMILTLKDCAERMNRLLARLSQHNRGGEEAAERFVLADAAQQVIDELGGTHALLLRGDRDCAVVGGRATMMQVVRHLVQNAIEASPGDEPVVLAIARADGPDGARARLQVADSGCGMTADFVRDDLFRPFVSTKAGGFGIGAFEARALVRAMGGALLVESAPGRGSRFTIDLPLAGTEAETEGPNAADGGDGTAQGGRPRGKEERE